MSSKAFFHSVTLDRDRCHGCINCVKRCPTEAIRVRDGKAKIIAERCIDCGECIRTCPHHAKQATFDAFSAINDFEYKIALPAPALYGQFNNLSDINIVLNALLKIGFDDVFEVSRAAEIVTDATHKYMARQDISLPVISSACPVVVRLIRVKYPQLIKHLLPLHSPMELAARLAKEEAHKKTGIPIEKIGAIFISPCPAKVTAVKMALGSEKSSVDAVFAIRDVYPRLLNVMSKEEDRRPICKTGSLGVSWGSSGGEAEATRRERYLAADGIENVIRVLEDLEDEKFYDLDFVEFNACSGGCVGGVLTVENPYVANAKLKRIRKTLAPYKNKLDTAQDEMSFTWEVPVEYEPVMELDRDMSVAMEKLKKMREIEARLYGMDCGSCGAPSCKALAEDIVRGFSSEEACIYKIREEMRAITKGLTHLQSFMPKATRDIDE